MPETTKSDDGIEIVYEILGDGPPLVLVHGSATFRGLWHSLGYVEALAPDYRLILVDLRGHGESEKPRDERAYAMEHLVAAQHGAGDRVFYPGFIDTIANRGIDAFLDEFGEHLGAPLDPGTRAIFQGADRDALVAYFRAMNREPGVPESVLHEIPAGRCETGKRPIRYYPMSPSRSNKPSEVEDAPGRSRIRQARADTKLLARCRSQIAAWCPNVVPTGTKRRVNFGH